MTWQQYITVDPEILVGKPIIKGTRISVELVMQFHADGWTEQDIIRNYPHLNSEQLRACHAYVADLLSREKVYPIPA